jgi:flagellar biosynthesis component FlhA
MERCRNSKRNCKEQADLVKDLVPNLITVSGIQRVLQILLAERVSIRDLATILEGVADGIAGSRNPVTRPSTCERVCRSRHSPSR